MILEVVMAPVFGWVNKNFSAVTNSRGYVLFQVMRTFLIVMVGYSIFKPASLHSTWEIWHQLTCIVPGDAISQCRCIRALVDKRVVLGTALIFLVDAVHFKFGYGVIRRFVRTRPIWMRWMFYAATVMVVLYYGSYGSGQQSFEYFRF